MIMDGGSASPARTGATTSSTADGSWWILEENLLHTGQASSMLREAVDGLTGNDPP